MNNQSIDTAIATLQSVSAFLYIGYVISALVCMFCVGDPKDTCVRFCLVLGIAMFAIVPIAAGITLAVTAGAYSTDAGVKGMGAVCAILCAISTTPCCAITLWALFCGSRGVRNESKFPAPISFVPLLWRSKEENSDTRDHDNSTTHKKEKPEKEFEVTSKDK